MRVVLGKRVDDERRADVSERADLSCGPIDDCQAAQNRDTNRAFGSWNRCLTASRVSASYRSMAASKSLVKMGTLVLSTFIRS